MFLFCLIVMIIVRMFFPWQYVFFAHDFRLRGIPVVMYNFLNSDLKIGFRGGLIDVPVYHVLCLTWGVGILLFGIRFIWKEYQNGVKLKKLSICSSKEAMRIKEQIEEKLGICRNIEIRTAAFNGSPFIYGYRNPVIVLPEKKYSLEEYYYILLHEMMHFKKKDFIWKMLTEVLIILYWWNPFVRLLRKELDKLLEFRNDDALLEFSTDKEKVCYMECILKTTKSTVQRTSSLRFRDESLNMKQRFHFIRFGIRRKFSAFGILLCMFVFLALFFFSVEPYHEPNDGSFDINVENAYFIKTEKGMYDLYSDGVRLATLSELPDSLPLPIYSKNKEMR